MESLPEPGQQPNLPASDYPAIPHPSIKSRHSKIQEQSSSTSDTSAPGEAKSSGSRSTKKTIVLILGVFVAAFVAMIGSILVPMIVARYFPPKWVADFRNAEVLSQKDWPRGQQMMLAAIAEGKRLNAPVMLQTTQIVHYAQALQKHGNFEEALKLFHDVSLMCESNHVPDRQGLACIFESECAHERFLNDPTELPDPQPAQAALKIFDKTCPDRNNEAFAALQLAKVYFDLGKTEASENCLGKVESLWSNEPPQLALVMRTRWRLQLESNVRRLAGKTHEPDCKATGTIVFNPELDQEKALKLLEEKDFRALDQLFAQTRTTRKRQDDGSELNDYLLYSVSYIDDASDAQWQQRLLLLTKWCRESNRSVTAHLALADFYGYYAQSVGLKAKDSKMTAADAQECLRRMYAAAVELGRALDAGPVTPEWFYVAEANIIVNSDKDDRELFDRLATVARTDFPDYMPIYMLESNYLQPKFSGAPSLWLKFVTTSADKFGGADGDRLYATMVNCAKEVNEKLNIECPTISWERVTRGTLARGRGGVQ
jgi:hypothetical protein